MPLYNHLHPLVIPEPNTGCWIWTGTTQRGYGILSVMRRGKKTSEAVHRTAYRQARGEIPPGLHIDHLCRNRSCVNPDHLEAVLPIENFRRGRAALPERKTHCKHGHPLTGDNVWIRKSGPRGRVCKQCYRARQQKRVP